MRGRLHLFRRSLSPTNPVTRFPPKQEEQCAGHYQCKKRVIPKPRGLGRGIIGSSIAFVLKSGKPVFIGEK
jgi:hypothetical protein